MPPKITAKQAEHFAEALVKGTPNRRETALTIPSDKVRELVQVPIRRSGGSGSPPVEYFRSIPSSLRRGDGPR